MTFPESLDDIGYEAFKGCTGLKSITIPTGLYNVKDYAFAYCTSLTNLTVSGGGYASLDIGYNAFCGCTSLVNVTFLRSAYDVWPNAFGGTPWEKAQGDFVIVGGVLVAYRGTSTNVTIPGNVTSIARGAFSGCDITSVTIPSGVSKIWDDAFYGCASLTNITVPNSVTEIGKDAFSGTAWKENQTGDFVMAGDVLINYTGTSSDVKIPDGVKIIGECAFSCCTSLTNVTIPASVTEIAGGAFDKCSELKVTILNPTCYITKYMFKTSRGPKGSYNSTQYVTFPYGSTIVGYDGSTAEKFASSNSFAFKSLGKAPGASTPTATPKPTTTPKPSSQLAAPTVKISKVSNGIQVSWNKVSGSARYMVYYKENGGSWTKIGTTDKTSYTRGASALKNGATYQFTVRCCAGDRKTLLSNYKASNSLKYTK